MRITLLSLTGFTLEKVVRFGFPASNNEVEYEALMPCLNLALGIDIDRLTTYNDSGLVVNQVKGDFNSKDPRMIAYRNKILGIMGRFKNCQLIQ